MDLKGVQTGLFLFGLLIRGYLYQTRVISFVSDGNNWAIWYKWIYYPTYSRLDDLARDTNLMLIICLVACLAVAFLMNEIIEKPFLKLRHKILGYKKKA
jgi:peptidoglycan/LPS O-acetylase OafA/YrhL